MHMITVPALLLFITLVAMGLPVFFLRPRNSRHLNVSAARAIKRLQPGRIEKIASLDGLEDLKADSLFWTNSGKLRGLCSRVLDLYSLMSVMQILLDGRPELRPEARAALRLAGEQVVFSLLALPEAIIAHFVPTIPHRCAKIAATLHVRITFDVEDIFYFDDTAESIGNLY